MKKIVLLVSSLLLACNFIVFSQVVLTSKTHGLIAGTTNPMKLIEYVEPGNGGQGVVWDFSGIKEKEDFQGDIIENNGASLAAFGSNVVLREFNNRFPFISSKNKLEQLGYYSGDGGDNYTRYDEPFVKMKYPFAYGDAYSGVYSGGQYQKDQKISSLSGNYEVSADGIGTLILPNGVVYKNALRVKELKRTTYNNSTTPLEEVTYRWYLCNYRFPVLVFIRSGAATGQSCKSFLSAYNPNVKELKSITDLNDSKDAQIVVYPNPASDFIYAKLNLTKESKIIVSIYDASGKYLGTVADNTFAEGEQTFSISAKKMSLTYGVYFLKISIDGNESIKNFVIAE